MTPGGHDIVLSGRVAWNEPDAVRRLITALWPDSVTVAADGVVMRPEGWCIGAELLVFRTQHDRISEGGRCIHVIFRPEQITFVVEDQDVVIANQLVGALMKERADRRYYCSLCHTWNGHETNCHFANQNTGPMEITIKLTNLSVQTSGGVRLTDEEITKLVHDRISKAFAEEPFTNGAWVDRYTAEVGLSTDKEFDLLTYTVETLKSFDQMGRDRILNYLVSRFGKK